MTIPTLTQNYKKKVVETKLSKFYSTMNQAIRLSEIDNGDTKTWDELKYFCTFDTEDEEEKRPQCKAGTEDALIWYNKYLAPYLKTAKVGTAQDKTYCASVSEDDVCENASDVILYFTDGSALQFSGRGFNYYIDSNKMEPDDRPDKWGINGFPFFFYPNNSIPIQPYYNTYAGWGCTSEESGANCTYVIWQNGWKIPDDYPFKL